MSRVPQIPVKKDADDHYRYKMPKLLSRKISSGNGVKTAILNVKDVSKAIGRSISCLNQWFGYSLAVQAKQGKNQSSDQIILNGNHSEDQKLLDCLYEFIDIFVLCPACQNPETIMEVQNKQLVLHCHSCGNVSPINPSNRQYVQRMIDWLIQHHSSEKEKQPSVATTQMKGKIDDIDDFKRTAEKDDISQGVYINVEELQALANQLEPKSEKEQPADAMPQQEQLDAFFNKMQALNKTDISNEDLYKECESFFNKYPSFPNTSKLTMIIEILFSGANTEFLNIIKKRNTFLIRYTLEESSQKDFIYLIGRFICRNKELMSSAPIIFYTLFNNEIFEEPAYQIWLKKPSARIEKTIKSEVANLRENILKDFTNWIQEAKYEEVTESNSDDEQEKEEDAKQEEKEDEDDLDIDNI